MPLGHLHVINIDDGLPVAFVSAVGSEQLAEQSSTDALRIHTYVMFSSPSGVLHVSVRFCPCVPIAGSGVTVMFGVPCASTPHEKEQTTVCNE